MADRSQTAMTHDRKRFIGATLSAALALFGLIMLALGYWQSGTKWHVFLAPPRQVLLAIGALQLALAALLRGMAPKVSLLLTAVSLSGALGFVGYRHVKYWRAPLFGEGVQVLESLNGGERPKPGTRARHGYYPDFLVTYTMDADGARHIAAPADPKGEVWVLGCSYTFGVGVEDHECWSALLARDTWRHFRVRNFGVSGWGDADIYRYFEGRLVKAAPPALVVYGWSAVHVNRNYLRASWWKQMRPAASAVVPHYEVESGKPVFQGLAPPDQWVEDTPDLEQREKEVTVALLQGMAAVCREKGSRFLVVQLDNNAHAADPGVMSALREAGIDAIDARPKQHLYFPHESWHGTPAWHRAVADAVRNDPRSAVQWNGQEAVERPAE